MMILCFYSDKAQASLLLVNDGKDLVLRTRAIDHFEQWRSSKELGELLRGRIID